jgi:phospholipid/cholesterol/gamma-HCH transport system ATP-binding protein
MIEVINIFKSFENNIVLDDVSVSFTKGKINMVIGSSGSGKTVLLKCIIGLLQPDKGKVLYDERNFTAMNYRERKILRKEVGMLFQGSALFNSLTVEENVGFALKMFTTMTSREVTKRVDFCLDRVNLGKVNNLYPQELSGGMQKRVGIARAIVMNPKYLFFDEPNSGLDPKTSRIIDKLIREITVDFNTTSLLNSHDMTSVFDIGDQVSFIHDSKIWWQGSSHEIASSNNPELLQMIEASGHDLPGTGILING